MGQTIVFRLENIFGALFSFFRSSFFDNICIKTKYLNIIMSRYTRVENGGKAGEGGARTGNSIRIERIDGICEMNGLFT